MRRPLTILTWHVHGSYLYYFSHVPHLVCLPVRPERPAGYGGALPGLPWPGNVREVPADQVRRLQIDCVLYQSQKNWEEDRYEILSPAQRRLPRIYLEHDPPRLSPTDTRHPVDDPDALLVHVTPFNALMWDSGRTPTRVIEHGAVLPAHVRYTGELARGIVVVNHLRERGRRLGADVFTRARERVPLDLVGMKSGELGGLGEIGHGALPAFVARYRFLFSPVRYTSLGLAVCEAMHAGVPVVGLATTEMATAIENGISGFVDTRLEILVARMRTLLADPALAARLGQGARRTARARFGIERFVRDWNDALAEVTGIAAPAAESVPGDMPAHA
jgi:hypothetical protein